MAQNPLDVNTLRNIEIFIIFCIIPMLFFYPWYIFRLESENKISSDQVQESCEYTDNDINCFGFHDPEIRTEYCDSCLGWFKCFNCKSKCDNLILFYLSLMWFLLLGVGLSFFYGNLGMVGWLGFTFVLCIVISGVFMNLLLETEKFGQTPHCMKFSGWYVGTIIFGVILILYVCARLE